MTEANFKKTHSLLGLGVLKIDDVDMGYSRGGGSFDFKRTAHAITADGDRGKHVGAVVLDQEVATLTMTMLELIPENMVKLFPALKSTTLTDTTTIEPDFDLKLTDYHKVQWTGKMMDGTLVDIIFDKAINLDPISWAMKEKDEVTQKVVFEACYAEQTDLSTYVAPYRITYKKAV